MRGEDCGDFISILRAHDSKGHLLGRVLTVSLLANIREIAQQVGDAIAAVLDIDVEIVDADLTRIAGTGKYRGYVGHSLAVDGASYKAVLATGQGMVLTRPGREPVCDSCPRQRTCDEMAELSAPVRLDERVIGVIGLLCFDETQRARLLSRLDSHQAFIERMAILLAGKAAEQHLWEQERLAAEIAELLLDHVGHPVVAIDREGTLIHRNVLADRLLGINEPAKSIPEATSRFPALRFLEQVISTNTPFDEREMFLDFDGSERPYMVSSNLLGSEHRILGAMAAFRPVEELHHWAYKITECNIDLQFDHIIGRSSAIKRLKEQAVKVAQSRSTVLIVGESGTGKELLARAIHSASPRATEPFVAINCAAIPDNLLESELFGYEAGSFTGAGRHGKPGKLEIAHGGTIFFDEIGDMPLHLQVKLLRVLQDMKVDRIGATRVRQVDVRVVAATNQDLEQKVVNGEFRRDLYFRLNVIPLNIPPLRERRDDILPLVQHFVAKFADLMNKDIRGLSAQAFELIEAYPWPGNIRELENTIEYAANMEPSAVIQAGSLPERIRLHSLQGASRPEATLADSEARMIEQVLRRTGTTYRGKVAAAKELGIGVATLYRKISRYGIRIS